MYKILDNSYLNLIFRLFLGGFFIVAGIAKIADPTHFSKEIINYNITPISIVNIIALFLPWLELIVGVLLAFGIKIKTNSIIIGVLLLIFILMVFSAMARGLNISCGCFGKASEQKTGWGKVFENLGLMILCIYLYFSNPEKFTFVEKY
ncbi:MAG: DoxX family membrane protein [Candidatus Kapabacteria bacterium]|nr:DoxX family membrane protein [Candidatus Kapabacteria bacterium]